MKKDIIGKRFGHLVVLDEYIKIPNGTKWKCRCDCGNETYVYRGKLVIGHTKSCGCLNHRLGGLSDHKLYSVWAGMKYRCYNEHAQGWHNYGEKGVKVCNEWKDDFLVFYNWSMENGYQDGLTIERKDADKDYCPENCEWISLSENVARANVTTNRRKTKYMYYGISPEGQKYTFSNANVFCKEHSLDANCVRRVAKGERNQHKGWKFGFTDELNL